MQKIKDNLGLIIVSLATVVYLYLSLHFFFDSKDFISLHLNEKGDFLAGVFAPLAFLWLVYGYYQQGQELKQNTDALRLQAEELKNSVEQQKEMLKTAHDELELAKAKDNRQISIETIQAQPFFHFKDFEYQFDNFENKGFRQFITFKLSNSRASCRELDYYAYEPNSKIEHFYRIGLIKGDPDYFYECALLLPETEIFNFDNKNELMLKIVFDYLDSHDSTQYIIIHFRLLGNDLFPEDTRLGFGIEQEYSSYHHEA